MFKILIILIRFFLKLEYYVMVSTQVFVTIIFIVVNLILTYHFIILTNRIIIFHNNYLLNRKFNINIIFIILTNKIIT